VFPFLRLVNVVECDRETLAATAPLIDALGGAEDLDAHVQAVRVRVPKEGAPKEGAPKEGAPKEGAEP